MRVDRFMPDAINTMAWMIRDDKEGQMVRYTDYVKLHETAQRLADALDNMPILSEGHLKVKDKALNEFYDDTLAP